MLHWLKNTVSHWDEQCYGLAMFIFVVITMVVFTLGMISGQRVEENRMKLEATKQGYAEFYLDENNDKQWRWLNKKEVNPVE